MNKITSRIFCGVEPHKKIKWATFAHQNHCLPFEEFSIKHNALGDLKVSMHEYSSLSSPRDVIELKNKENKVVGSEILAIDSDDKTMYGYEICVSPEYRKKGFRLGEILRTFSVLSLLKNEASHMQIYSVDDAIYFHSKYKFKPLNFSLLTRDNTLDIIANDGDSEFSLLSREAKSIQKRLMSGVSAVAEERISCQDTNELIECYINKALEKKDPEIHHPFYHGFEMILTRENIVKNKEFFNNLFKKYGIDYTI